MFLIKICALIFAANLVSAQFSHETSEKMINFVAASFTPFMSHDYTLANACFEKSYPNGNWMTVFSFKGTIGKDDMNQTAHGNLDTYVPWINGNVSYGNVNPDIVQASNGAYDVIAPLIFSHRGYNFIFTGHSLGGAIASLTALTAKLAIKTANISLFTFGEPRYHEYKLAQTFENNLSNGFRVIHDSDVVPHMPMCGTRFSASCTENTFYHYPQEIWFNKPSMNDSNYKLCSSSNGEDPKCSNSISEPSFLLNFGTDLGAEMHMTYYNQKLDDYGYSGCGQIPCEDVATDCASKNKECTNSLYKPAMCKYCRKTCNLCNDRKCYN
uniref:ShKT domain-containing protein n=1 Tax=Panagrolaimus sp. ES5 TaxID=591445 RepID=A0AC34G5G2_9BILA